MRDLDRLSEKPADGFLLLEIEAHVSDPVILDQIAGANSGNSPEQRPSADNVMLRMPHVDGVSGKVVEDVADDGDVDRVV
jgi:hypothetical protein